MLNCDCIEQGPELDSILASLTIGWKLVRNSQYHGLGGATFLEDGEGKRRFMWHNKENVYSGEKSWSPSNVLADALEIVKHYRQIWVTRVEVHPDYVYAEIFRGSPQPATGRLGWSSGNDLAFTLSRVILEVILKSKGIETFSSPWSGRAFRVVRDVVHVQVRNEKGRA